GDVYPDIRPGLYTHRVFPASARLYDVLGANLERTSVRHGLLGVDEHVGEHLDELGLVCRQGPEIRRDVKRAAHVGSPQSESGGFFERARNRGWFLDWD